ncbi:unnamed protein product [Paramecium primaurelia]|uniref:Amino acid transporter transmembrane domain-containing protein n=1 Tax=Paramecium primaurelia TaxID=5886 RepID=A0A8S1KYN0_PARPR|nr:unnamed protein product [Paramecium primaurelia]
MRQNKPSQDAFDEVQGSYSMDDQFNVQEGYRNSIDEIPANQLSGDEALEKSFMQSTGQSSIWQKKGQKTSIPMTSVIVMKSMVGVGILGIPYVASNFGAILTILILMIIFFLGILSSNLLLKSKNLSKRSNFSTIGFYIFKHKWIIIVVNVMIILSNLGVCLSELIIFGDTASNLINYFTDRDTDDQPFYLTRPVFLIVISIMLLPFLLVKSIEKLRFVSLFAILSISSFSCLVIYNFFRIEQTNSQFSWWIPDNFNINRALASMPTLILAFNWQFNLFPIFKGMAQPTDQNLIKSTIFGFCQGSLLYLIVGLLGYATYGTNIEPNFLLSIDEKDVGPVLFVILNLTFVFSTTLTLPVIFFGGRNNFIQMIKQFTENKKVNIQAKKKLLDDQQTEQYYKDLLQFRKKSQAIRFYGISITLFILLAIGAVFIKNLGTVYNLLGAIACNAIQLGLPTLFYVFLVKQVKKMKFRNNLNRIFYFFVCGLLGVSIILTFLCVTCEFIKPEKEVVDN